MTTDVKVLTWLRHLKPRRPYRIVEGDGTPLRSVGVLWVQQIWGHGDRTAHDKHSRTRPAASPELRRAILRLSYSGI